MIHFERSFDYELICRIMVHPRIWPHISDDGSPPAAEYRPIESESIWYIVVRDLYPDAGARDLLGLWMFVPQNSVCWEVHTCLLPCAWGERGLRAAKLLPNWIWRNTPCRRIITNVPRTNRLAYHFAIKAGMRMFGVNIASYLKDGKYCDQICLGISHPDVRARREADLGLGLIETIAEEELCGKER